MKNVKPDQRPIVVSVRAKGNAHTTVVLNVYSVVFNYAFNITIRRAL